MWGRREPAPPPAPVARKPAVTGGTIVIDPGHGGKDPGTKELSARPEKEIVLNIGQQVGRLLQDRGMKVVMTRSNDQFIELDDRAATAERTRADLFVSIHADSAARSSASGATIYVGRNASGSSVRAAAAINSALTSAGLETRGVKRAGFRVLVGHSRPAVLVECGFLTNPGDANRLNNSSEQMKVARVIADGIQTYFTRWRPLAKR
jgi:N-acetylmuramoyl-L-alanine amidase